MSDIDELERRIAAALERISKGVEQLGTAAAAEPGDAGEASASAAGIAALEAALEDERMANAQLEERVKAIREKQESQVAALREEAEAARRGLADLDTELQRLRQANDMLSSTNEEMRRALEEKVGEPHLINKAMLAELEGLRAARAADAAETQAVLSALTPLLAEAEERAATQEAS